MESPSSTAGGTGQRRMGQRSTGQRAGGHSERHAGQERRSSLLCVGLACAIWITTIACHAPVRLRPLPHGESRPPPSWASGVPLLLLADLQNHAPYEEIELPPRLTAFGKNQGHLEKEASGFYRHALRSTLVPAALEWTILQAKARGIRYGVLAGDMADLGCNDELLQIMAVLRRHPQVRFALTLGNHDVAPIGTMPTRYLPAWEKACRLHGGVLSKREAVAAVLDYYRDVLGLALPRDAQGPQIRAGGAAVVPSDWRAVRVEATQASTGDRLSFEGVWRTAPGECAEPRRCAHQESYLFHRLTVRAAGHTTALSMLDTVDYSASALLAATLTAKVLHLGIAGGVSPAQVAFFRSLGGAQGLHLTVSHYVPFERIEQRPAVACRPRGPRSGPGGPVCWQSDFGKTSITQNAESSGLQAYLLGLGDNAVVVYAHSHEAALGGRIEGRRADGTGVFVRAQRLPSLIDNASAVLFSGGVFAPLRLPREGDLLPLDGDDRYWSRLYGGDLCKARARDYYDTGRLLARYTLGACPREPLRELREEAEALCRHVWFERGLGWRGDSRVWQRDHQTLWRSLRKGACNGVLPQDVWRCVFRARAADLLRRCLGENQGRTADFGARVVGAPSKLAP